MNPEDKSLFAKTLTGLAMMFNYEMDDTGYEIWWQAMQDVDIYDFTTAARKAINSCRYMPKPVEIRELLGALNPQDRSLSAWSAVRNAIRRYGASHSVDFGDPAIHATVRAMGGWDFLCDQETDWLTKWGLAQFSKTYQAIHASGPSYDEARYLAGWIELENYSRGYKIEPPMKVPTGLPDTQYIGRVPLPQGRPLPAKARALVESIKLHVTPKEGKS